MFIFGVPIASAAGLSSDQKDVVNLIKRMYAIPPLKFEYGEFEGRFQPQKHCPLISMFFVKEALVKSKQGGCETSSESGVYFRYPTASDEDLSGFGRDLPSPRFGVPVISGDLAELMVLFTHDRGRSVYYLRRLSEGWRIYKVRVDDHSDIDERKVRDEDRKLYWYYYFPPGSENKR